MLTYRQKKNTVDWKGIETKFLSDEKIRYRGDLPVILFNTYTVSAY